jgi:hypothetical protein
VSGLPKNSLTLTRFIANSFRIHRRFIAVCSNEAETGQKGWSFRVSLDEILADEYSDLPPRQLEQVLEETLGDVSPEDLENFWGSLKNVGGAVSKALPGIASGALTGATTGAALGPWGALGGALIGGTLGGMAQPSGQQPPQQPSAPQRPMPSPPSHAQQPPQTVSPALPAVSPVPAAAQLLQTMFQPEVLQALMAMLMGQAGRRNIPVSGTQVPVGAFTNLLGVLASKAAAEYTAVVPNGGSPEYLYDYAGQPKGDPAVDEHRAQALWELLREADAKRRRSQGSRRSAYREERQPVEQFYEEELDEEFYDWFELTELGGGYAS